MSTQQQITDDAIGSGAAYIVESVMKELGTPSADNIPCLVRMTYRLFHYYRRNYGGNGSFGRAAHTVSLNTRPYMDAKQILGILQERRAAGRNKAMKARPSNDDKANLRRAIESLRPNGHLTLMTTKDKERSVTMMVRRLARLSMWCQNPQCFQVVNRAMPDNSIQIYLVRL